MIDQGNYWLVYLYDPEDPADWVAVGIVENRQTWADWWQGVIEGENDIPDRFDGWYASDRLVTPGLGVGGNDE